MKPAPAPWRNPTVERPCAEIPPALSVLATTRLPVDADLTALIERDRSLLRTLQAQCEVRNLYLVHDGREIKVTPFVAPGWRVITETEIAPAQ